VHLKDNNWVLVALAIVLMALTAIAIFAIFAPTPQSPEQNGGGSEENPYRPPIQKPPSECESGIQRDCTAYDGCSGTQWCLNGAWSDCSPQRRICIPGSAVGCVIDGCSFGSRVCNKCGTGYSECAKEIADESVPCSGESCG
jgi:hypothetical protein